MLIFNYSMNFNGESQIDEKQIMTMNASHDGNQISVTETILDIDAYLANKDTADSDYTAFKNKILESIAVETGNDTTETDNTPVES